MKLEHYSNNPDLVTLGIDPKFYGKGVTGQERHRRKDPDWVNRSYFYLAGTKPERSVGALPYVYTVTVPDSKIYDIGADPLDLKKNSMWGPKVDLSRYESEIKKAGFLGFSNPGMDDPTMSKVVALFHAIKPEKVREVTRSEALLSRIEDAVRFS